MLKDTGKWVFSDFRSIFDDNFEQKFWRRRRFCTDLYVFKRTFFHGKSLGWSTTKTLTTTLERKKLSEFSFFLTIFDRRLFTNFDFKRIFVFFKASFTRFHGPFERFSRLWRTFPASIKSISRKQTNFRFFTASFEHFQRIFDENIDDNDFRFLSRPLLNVFHGLYKVNIKQAIE